MKKKLIIIIPIVVILLAIILIFLLNSLKEKPNPDKSKVVEDVIQNVFYNDSITISDLKKELQSAMPSEEVFLGKDSVIRKKPSDELIKRNNLKAYESIQNKYYKNVEKKFKENASYKIVASDDKKVSIDVIPWYYSQYASDLSKLTYKLLNYANYEVTEDNYGSKEYEVNEYKARVIAMRIMNRHLDEYDNNTKEVLKCEVEFTGDKPGEFDYYTVYLMLEGITAEKAPSKDEQAERINQYIEDAKQAGIFNENTPYKI